MTLQQIAGYTTPRTVWTLIANLTEGWKPGSLANITPTDIAISDDHFTVSAVRADLQSTRKGKPGAFSAPEAFAKDTPSGAAGKADVWTLGALAFYAIMGMHVFEGKGGLTQTAATVVPRIGSQHCPQELSQLVHKCLSFDPASRPGMDSLNKAARTALAEKPLPPKRLATATGSSYKTELVKFWPEEMVTAIILFFMMLLPSTVRAQATPDDEMTALVAHAIDLRQPQNEAKVRRALSLDYQWTMMDEIDIDREGECTTQDEVASFGMNALGFRISKYHGGVVNAGGRFNNGQDARYNYSFIEITVKQGHSVSYDIFGREGHQLFAIVPYEAGASFQVSATKGGSQFGTAQSAADGVQYLSLSQPVVRDDHFTLTIRNNSGKNQSFVIINHNTRK